jgi:lipocalin
VGSGKQYLWFLSRKSQISDKKFTELTKIAQQKGYDTTKLQKTIRNKKS